MSIKKLQHPLLAILVLFSCHVNATTYQVPPPNSAKKNNATANIAEGINTIRKRGLKREADQLQKLFNNGRIFYRTSGQHKHDAQYIHSFPPDEKKDTLYFAVQHVKYISGVGTQRYDNSNYRYKYLMVLVGLHEMVQGSGSTEHRFQRQAY